MLVAKFIYRQIVKVPGVARILSPIVKRIRRSNFNFDHVTSLDMRILFLESVIAGLEERISKLERRS